VQILAYAHQLDNGYLPEKAAEVKMVPQTPVVDEIGYYLWRPAIFAVFVISNLLHYSQ
jgi:hypothetical protein